MVRGDIWQEVALMSISKEGGSEVNFHSITDTMNFEFGEKDVSGKAMLNGGRVMLWSPEEDTKFTFECYPSGIGTYSGTEALGVLDMKYQKSATENPQQVFSSIQRDKHRITVMWAEDTTVTTATGASGAGKEAARYSMTDVYITNVTPDYSEKHLKYIVTAKCGVRDRLANPNMMFESTTGAGTTQLAALAPYTSTVKFRA
jgi:hypothetical protein